MSRDWITFEELQEEERLQDLARDRDYDKRTRAMSNREIEARENAYEHWLDRIGGSR